MSKYKSISIFLFSLLLLSSGSISAQDYTVDWGPIYKKPGGINSDLTFLGIYEDHYYLIVQTRNENMLLQYNMEHKLVDQTPLVFNHNNDRLEIKDIITTQDGPFIYMHYFSEKYKEWIIYASRFDGGQFSEPEEIYFEGYDISHNRLNLAYRNFYENINSQKDLVLSQDSSHVAFVNVIPSEDYRQDDLISVVVWDSKLNIKWKALYDFKFGDKDFNVKEAVVSNSGEVFFLASVDKRLDLNGKPISLKQRNLPDYVFNIYKLTENEIIENKIDIGRSKGIVDAGLFVENEETGEILLGGFYTTDNPKSRVEGVFFASGTKNIEMGDYKVHPFNSRFLEGLARTKAIKKKKGLSYNYNIKHLLRYNDGTMGFVAENSFVTRNTNGAQMMNSGFGGMAPLNFTYSYTTDEIIIPRFNLNGELLNIEKIDKSYRSDERDYTSFALAEINDEAILIFNDRKSKKESKKINKKGNRYTDMAIIGPNGSIKYYETLFSNRESELPFIPQFFGFSEDYLIVGGSFGSKFTFGCVDLKTRK